MQLRNSILCLVLLGAIPGLAVDPAMMNLVSPESKVVTGMDIDRMKNSPFGQYLMSQMKLMEEDGRRFMDTIGFDPSRDLREVLASVNDVEAKSSGGVLMIRGTFDETKVAAFAATSGASMTSHQGVRMITPHNGSHDMAMAFAAGNLLILGEQAGVKSAIDRMRAGSKLDAKIAAKMQSASNGYDAWVLTTGSPTSLAGSVENPNMKGMMNSDLMKGIESMIAGVRFGANVEFGAEAMARSERDAQALADVVSFFLSMAQSNGGRGQGPAQILETLETKVDGRVVRLTLRATEQDFEKMFAPQKKVGPKVRVKPAAVK